MHRVDVTEAFFPTSRITQAGANVTERREPIRLASIRLISHRCVWAIHTSGLSEQTLKTSWSTGLTELKKRTLRKSKIKRSTPPSTKP